jgi:hypothetical protein
VTGWAGWAGLLARKKKKRPVGQTRAEIEERERERGGEERVFLFLLNFSFQIHFSNIQTSIKQKSMHSNHDAQALIISKLF